MAYEEEKLLERCKSLQNFWGARDEILTMEERSSSKAARPVRRSRPAISERTINVKRSEVDESLKDINKILTQARIRPHFKDGQADGLTITGIKAGSVFRRLGLRNGDILNGINGSPIESPDDILSVYDDIKSGADISIQLRRRGRETTLNYRFR